MDTPQTAEAPMEQAQEQISYSLWQLVSYFLRLGTIGFGGPVALVGYMQRDLVEKRAWIAEADYKEGLALAQLCPGPLAAQLAMYLGYVRYRTLGATLVGLAFIWPSFLMVVALGWLYTLYGGLPWMQAVFYGVGASVIGIVALSALKLTTRTIGRDPLLWGIYLVMGVVTVLTQTEQVLLFLAAAFLFGSGLAIIPFLYGGVVQGHHWLTDRQFVDAVAVAMITPGPVVITSGFIGFLVAG